MRIAVHQVIRDGLMGGVVGAIVGPAVTFVLSFILFFVAVWIFPKDTRGLNGIPIVLFVFTLTMGGIGAVTGAFAGVLAIPRKTLRSAIPLGVGSGILIGMLGGVLLNPTVPVVTAYAVANSIAGGGAACILWLWRRAEISRSIQVFGGAARD